MNLNLLQKKSVINTVFSNFPRKLDSLSLNDQVEQIFCSKYHHFLEKIYRFSMVEKNVGDFICLIALLDFEKFPTKLKRDFMMQHFVNDKDSLYFLDISGKNRRAIRQSVKIEDLASQESLSWGYISSRNIAVNNMNPFLLPQLPNTFTSTLFKTALRNNISEIILKFKKMEDFEITKIARLSESEFSIHNDFIMEMQGAGFKVPRFMQNMKSG